MIPGNCSRSKYGYPEIVNFQVTMPEIEQVLTSGYQYPEVDQKAKMLGQFVGNNTRKLYNFQVLLPGSCLKKILLSWISRRKRKTFLIIFNGENLGSRYYGFMKKTRLWKSHANQSWFVREKLFDPFHHKIYKIPQPSKQALKATVAWDFRSLVFSWIHSTYSLDSHP